MNFYKSDFSASEGKNSGAMKKIMANEDVAHILRDKSKQETFYKTLKKYSGSSNALQKTLGELRANKNDSINNAAANALGRELIKSGRRFISPEKIKNAVEQKRGPYVSASSSSRVSGQSAPLMSRPTTGAQLSQTFTKNTSSVMRSGLVKN
jgi:ribonuclease D